MKNKLIRIFYKIIKCPHCGKQAQVGTCGNFWCPHCKKGHW